MTVESMSDVSPAPATDFRAQLLQAWQGEVFGIEVYGALAESRTDPTERMKLGELLALEEYMEQELVGVLERLSIEADLGDTMQMADSDISEQRSASWFALMTWLRQDAEAALADYQPMRALSSGVDEACQRVVTQLIAHELALVTFCVKELAGESDSLADVRALLSGDPL